jgi:GNAT superfamily N-acetyltransferase
MARFFLGDRLVKDQAPGKGELLTAAPASVTDLLPVNQVIEQAVMAWPLSERLRRLSLPLLTYAEIDWQYYEFLVIRDHNIIVAMTAWDPHTLLSTKHGNAALLHGLYVTPHRQGQGLGWNLVRTVADRARSLRVEGLLIKAERVAVSYFEQHGLQAVAPASRQDYPYQFWLDLQA